MIHPRQATNSPVLASQYTGKPRGTDNSHRVCAADNCNTILSRYNLRDELCAPCRSKAGHHRGGR